jgi:hypothetical protein
MAILLGMHKIRNPFSINAFRIRALPQTPLFVSPSSTDDNRVLASPVTSVAALSAAVKMGSYDLPVWGHM